MKSKISKSSLALFASFIMWMFAMSNAHALICYVGEDTSATAESVTLSTIAYLKGTANGDRIWESQTYNRTVTCKSELRDSKTEENLYVYPYPRRGTQQLPEGVKLGLIFDGDDLGIFNADGDVYASRVATKHIIEKGQTKSLQISFKVYLVKEGEISTQGMSDLTLFQLDGVNSLKDKNYAFSINGWDNIGSVSCDTAITSKNATISSIDTDKALAGTASEESALASIKINCSSESANVLSNIKSVNGTLRVNGTAFSGNSSYFATDKTGLGVGLSYDGTSLAPAGTKSVSVPVSAGVASQDLTFTLKPYLTTSLALGNPAWLFTDEAQAINSTMTMTFTPQSLNIH
ncbi:hypothetical protein [Sodalis glossinidius]|nr:hypothetical protein [Sodalis glossinidius]